MGGPPKSFLLRFRCSGSTGYSCFCASLDDEKKEQSRRVKKWREREGSSVLRNAAHGAAAMVARCGTATETFARPATARGACRCSRPQRRALPVGFSGSSWLRFCPPPCICCGGCCADDDDTDPAFFQVVALRLAGPQVFARVPA